MEMAEQIKSMESYISTMIMSEYPDLETEKLEEKILGVRYNNKYLWDPEKKALTLSIDTLLDDDSPEWLGKLIGMCMREVGYALDDYPIKFLNYFQQVVITDPPTNIGDVYLVVLMYDKQFIFHLPLSMALHIIPEEILKKMKSNRKHWYCREVIAELATRARYTP